MKGAVYVNGTITPADQAVVPVYDHGFVYGEGVYETLRTYNRIPFLFEQHMRRLRASAAALQLAVPFADDSMRGWIDDTMAAASRLPDPRQQVSNEAYIRILLTRGVGELTYDIDATPAPSLVIIVKPFDEPPARVFEEGITVSLVSILRNHPGSVNPIIKSNNLLNNAMAMQEARRKGGDEALMCNYRGELSECSMSNFFLVRDGVALTPTLGCGAARRLDASVHVRGRPRSRRCCRGSDAAARGSGDRAGGLRHRLDARADAGGPRRRSRDRHRPAWPGDHEAAGRLSAKRSERAAQRGAAAARLRAGPAAAASSLSDF